MTDTETQLLKTLSDIHGTGKFSAAGSTPFFFPDIAVHGEKLGFPLPPIQAQHLISQAEAAPYGKGEETVRDEAVRKCWQIDATHLDLPKSGPWKKYLSDLVKDVAETMGVAGTILATPYKLLIYEKGGHFLPHRDTEKIEAMFGSLIIALPSAHSGGELIIRHDDKEIAIDFSNAEKLQHFQHAAFFADCEHEVTPVKSGYRVCIAFNLAQKRPSPQALNQNISSYTHALNPLLKKFRSQSDGALKAILLSHQYTPKSFSLPQLKNDDLVRAIALMEAAQNAGFIAHLGLITLHQMGELEGAFDHSHRRKRYWDDDDDDEIDGTMGDIYEESLCIETWIKPDGSQAKLGTYAITNHDLVPETKLDSGDPDEKEAEGYTGNAGCTMDYWYYKAAVVLWPKENAANICCKYDLRSTAEQFLAACKKSRKPSKKLVELGTALIAETHRCSQTDRHYGLPLDPIFQGICYIGSAELLEQCLAAFGQPLLGQLDAASWSQLIARFDSALFEPHISKITQESISERAAAIIDPLDALLSKKPAHPLTKIAANKLEFVSIKRLPNHYAYRRTTETPKTIHSFLAASHLADSKATLKHFREQVAQDRSLEHLREILAPALQLKTHRRQFGQPGSLYPEILTQAISQLTEEINRELTPYNDWRRPMAEPQKSYPRGPHFNELHQFMHAPDRETFEIKARADIRDSISALIQRENLDLDQKTIKGTTPHILHLSKNAASYARSVRQRQSDIKLLAKLSALLPTSD